MGKKKKLTPEEQWMDQIKKQDQTIYEKEHTYSKKELQIAKKFMEKGPRSEERSVSIGEEKVFAPEGKDFDAESRFKDAKTVNVEEEGENKQVYAEDPKKERYVHMSDDTEFVENIEIERSAQATGGKQKKTLKKVKK